MFWSNFWLRPPICFTFWFLIKQTERAIGRPSSFHSTFRQSSGAEWNWVFLDSFILMVAPPPRFIYWARGFLSPDWHIKQRGKGRLKKKDEIVAVVCDRNAHTHTYIYIVGRKKRSAMNQWMKRIQWDEGDALSIGSFLFQECGRPSHDWSSHSLSSPLSSTMFPFANSACFLMTLSIEQLLWPAWHRLHCLDNNSSACHSLLISIDVFAFSKNSFCRLPMTKHFVFLSH